MNKQQLAAKIWESANKMRSKIEANEYKDYILGFIFYKFLSEKEVKYLKNNDWTNEYLPELKEEDEETVISIQKNLGYFISYENLFSTWLSKGKDFSVQDVHDALSAFSRLINPTHKKVFDGIFNTLQTGLSKLGDSAASQSKSISDLIYLIKDIPMDGKQGYDVLGFIYEYLIEKFAANAGKKAGEFYTPHEVSLLMSEIVAEHLKNREKIEIFDPTSGSASLLINIGKSASKYIEGKNKIKYYAQELKQNTYNLTRMNLVMRGIEADNIVTRNGDTLEDDWPYFDENDPIVTYNPLYVDAVVSNPPYSQGWNPSDKETDPRYAGYGLAPKGKADYAFLLHDLYHIKPDGIMNIVLPHGVLFRGGEEGEIRKNLIEKNKIDTIIGLPANIFYGTGIPTIVMVLKQKRVNTDVLIIDASKGFVKEGKNNKLRASDIKKIVDVVTRRECVEKFSRVVSRDEIRRNDYNLNISRYVDSSEKAESWDIYASMFGGLPISEINDLKEYWTAFPKLKTALLEKTEGEYSRIVVTDIKKAVKENECVQAFEQSFKNAFGNFDDYLYNELIEKMDTLGISKTEEVLSLDIFARLKDIHLVDKYEAYQLLDDDWTKIAIDLEIIQTEGFEATKVVDPNMVVKKKGNLEQEVQEGWKGRIIPFDLVQNTLLLDEKQEIQKKENRLSEITSKYEELFDMLTEEEKEADFVNENSFVFAEIKKALKNKDIEVETKKKLKEVEALNTEEKELKSEVKKESALLEEKTKETIESLSDEQVRQLLKEKWIHPLIKNLMQLPDRIVSELVDKLKALAKKYETTFAEIESQIEETEKELSLMIDDLEAGEFDMRGLYEFKKLLGGE
ncbi:type I restriction-modification system subunit M [Fusobacterium pseudoperiodonticum]|jgi:type I restriction-modification system, M subunit|uniref:type I restriction-modification system subunit M n=1 Tax=Fusobacterium pseudoperiodonticum TaxID=2663009 RepID=UPI000C1BE770|nr:type I restriction-modification system subunit M [Fusobacterium pseudoperiodonticum]ATV73067.1 type I restriction-modification system subunit M [Fusobacterium pseudoperiodonticum]